MPNRDRHNGTSLAGSSDRGSAELDCDLEVRLGGLLNLFQLDPFVLRMSLSNIARAQDEARSASRGQRAGIRSERDAGHARRSPGDTPHGLLDRLDPVGGLRWKRGQVDPGRVEFDISNSQ